MGSRELLESAKSLAPLIESEAAKAEERGSLTQAVVQSLHESGLLGLLVPRDLGGAEADLGTALEVFEELSRADGSTGWAVMANATSACFAGAYTGDQAAKEMFPDGTMSVLAGMYAPVGRAEERHGGYTVSGNYSFASGSDYADWMGGGAFQYSSDGEMVLAESGFPVIRVFFLSKDKVELRGNWDVMGLVATGSYDYSVQEQFVEEGFTFSLLEAERRRGGRMYDLGVLSITAAGHAGFALGVARRAVDELTRVVKSKYRLGAAAAVADQQLFRHDLAMKDAALRAARAFVFEAFRDAETRAVTHAAVGVEQHSRLRQATTYATRVAGDVVKACYLWAGSDALRSPSALQRCFRDIHAGTQHIFVDNNTMVDMGQLLLNEHKA